MFNKLVVKTLRSQRDKELNKKISETMDKFMREKDFDKASMYLEELKTLKTQARA